MDLLHGSITNYGHIFIVWATRNAQANVLPPFQYVEIVSTVFLGYLVFGDTPAMTTVIGVTIIILSGSTFCTENI